MAPAGGVVSRLARQGLLQTVARPRTRSRLLVRNLKPRWISSEGQAGSDQHYPFRPENVREKDRWILEGLKKAFRTIDQKQIVPCKEPVRIVDSGIERVCSWNEASGSRQAIYVPGDASRPRKTSLSLSTSATHGSLSPAMPNRPLGHCNLGRAPRHLGWDDCLAALYATDPELRLDQVDVMLSDEALLYLLLVAQNGAAPFFGNPLRAPVAQAFNMVLSGNTLVVELQSKSQIPNTVRVPTTMQKDWEYFKAATEPVPHIEDSSVHHQLLRYKMGPLSCLVRVKVNGTVQEMPTSTSPSEPPQMRDLHGIDVINAGQGVHPTSTFQAVTRFPLSKNTTDSKRLRLWSARLLICGQTRLGFADVVPADRFEELGGLTVVDMADLVREYENVNQRGLCRVAGLLMALRDAVRAHGAPCVGTFLPSLGTAKSSEDERNFAIHLHACGPDETPVLLDWHKEHFWSQNKVRRMQSRPGRKTTKAQSRPEGTTNDEDVPAPRSLVRKWVQWLGF